LDAVAALTPANPEQLASTLLAQARIALVQHDIDIACAAAKQALDLRAEDDPKTGWRHAEAVAVNGECLAARKEFAPARIALQAALADLVRVRGADHWMTRPVRRLQRCPGRRRRVPRSTMHVRSRIAARISSLARNLHIAEPSTHKQR
jgi:hypothetical protein